MYRESIALYVHQHSPGSEVLLAPPGSLDEIAEGFSPHLLVRDDGDGAGLWTRALCRVGLFYDDDGMHARIGFDGESREVRNISMDDLLEVVDQTEKLIPQGTMDLP